MYQVLKNLKRNLLQKSTILNKEANKKALTVKGGCFLFCILIEYSFCEKSCSYPSMQPCSRPSCYHLDDLKKSVLYVRFSSWYHSAFSPESQEYDSVKPQKFLVPCKNFRACVFFYVMSTNPHQTRSQNLPEHNLPLF